MADGVDPIPARGELDLHMMIVSGGGKERTLPEWRRVLSASGFELSSAHPTRSLFSVLEARPRSLVDASNPA